MKATKTKKKEQDSHHGVARKGAARKYANGTLELLCERASCRQFSKRRIPAKTVSALFEAGVRSATGGNLQPYSIISSGSAASREKIASLCGQGFLADAPLHLLFCIDWRRLGRWASLEAAPFTANDSFRHFWISFQDTMICAQTICTAADSLGLGSVYIGTVIDCLNEVRGLFALPDGVMPVVLVALGYPKSRPAPRRKLGPGIIVHGEKYRDLPDRELLDAFGEKYEGQKIPAGEENLEKMRAVSEAVGGRKLADRVLERIGENGCITPAQRYFGLHYQADLMASGNRGFIETMRKFGFGWFDDRDNKVI